MNAPIAQLELSHARYALNWATDLCTRERFGLRKDNSEAQEFVRARNLFVWLKESTTAMGLTTDGLRVK